jgi:hypothetical protein
MMISSVDFRLICQAQHCRRHRQSLSLVVVVVVAMMATCALNVPLGRYFGSDEAREKFALSTVNIIINWRQKSPQEYNMTRHPAAAREAASGTGQ